MTSTRKRSATGKLAASLFCLSLLAAACGGDDDAETSSTEQATEDSTGDTSPPDTSGGESTDGLKVACMMIDLSLEAFVNICQGVQEVGDEAGAEVVLGDGKSDPAEQSRLMDSYITQGVDIVVTIAQDPGSLQAQIERAQEAGIVVVALGTPLETADLQVVSKFYNEGQAQADAVVDWVNENVPTGDPTILVTDYPATAVLVDRADGTQDRLEESLPDATIVRTAANSREEGIAAVQAALQENPDVRVMTCISDDACLGGAQAFREAGIDSAELFVIGTDATASAFQSLEAGDSGFKATAGYGLRVYGAAGLSRALACFAGEDVEQTVIMNNQVVTIDNLEEFRTLDEDPVRAYNDFRDRYITVEDSTLATCPPAR